MRHNPMFLNNIQSLDLDKYKYHESIYSADADENRDSSYINIGKFFIKDMEVVHCLN